MASPVIHSGQTRFRIKMDFEHQNSVQSYDFMIQSHVRCTVILYESCKSTKCPCLHIGAIRSRQILRAKHKSRRLPHGQLYKT